jgi:hypothetical protein
MVSARARARTAAAALCSSHLAARCPRSCAAANNDKMLSKAIQRGEYSMERSGWSKVSDGAKNTIRQMLVVNPAERAVSAAPAHAADRGCGTLRLARSPHALTMLARTPTPCPRVQRRERRERRVRASGATRDAALRGVCADD